MIDVQLFGPKNVRNQRLIFETTSSNILFSSTNPEMFIVLSWWRKETSEILTFKRLESEF